MTGERGGQGLITASTVLANSVMGCPPAPGLGKVVMTSGGSYAMDIAMVACGAHKLAPSIA